MMNMLKKTSLLAVLAGSALMAGSANAWFGNWMPWGNDNYWGGPWGGYPGYWGGYPGYYGAYPGYWSYYNYSNYPGYWSYYQYNPGNPNSWSYSYIYSYPPAQTVPNTNR